MAVTAKKIQQNTATILCVDDEPSILESLKRLCNANQWQAICVNSGLEALNTLLEAKQSDRSIDLILSDMRMPSMTGAELLKQTRQLYPDIPRILLTGYADIDALSKAVNECAIYNYISKPWDTNLLTNVIKSALEFSHTKRERLRLENLTRKQNQRLKEINEDLDAKVKERTIEIQQALTLLNLSHEKLQSNFSDTLNVLAQLMDFKEGRDYRHSHIVCAQSCQLGKRLSLSEIQLEQLHIASLLHDIGCLSLPESVFTTPKNKLDERNKRLYKKHVLLAEAALMNAPSLAEVGKIIRAHHECINGSGFPDGLKGEQIPIESRIIHIVSMFHDLEHGRIAHDIHDSKHAKEYMLKLSGQHFDANILTEFFSLINEKHQKETFSFTVNSLELSAGMILAKDIVSSRGLLLLTQGTLISNDIINSIKRIEKETAEGFTFLILATQEEN